MALKDKLKKIKMEKGDNIAKYLTKFIQCRDELGSVGITVADDDLMSLSLLGLPRVGTVIKTLSMDGRNCRIGSDFGQILCRRR